MLSCGTKKNEPKNNFDVSSVYAYYHNGEWLTDSIIEARNKQTEIKNRNMGKDNQLLLEKDTINELHEIGSNIKDRQRLIDFIDTTLSDSTRWKTCDGDGYFGKDALGSSSAPRYDVGVARNFPTDTTHLIQELIDFIKNEGYKITVAEPIIKINHGNSCIGYMSILQCYNAELKNIVIHKNDTPEEIYKYLLGIKETIIAKNKYLEKLKPDPIFEHLKF
jgi:hypothetical protein